VAVLGAGGTIAPAIVRDLAESEEVQALTLLDLDGERARAVAEAHGAGRAVAAAVDASDRAALAAALDGHHAVLNAASYRVNLAVMDAALAARCAYLDLGGLYHVSARQYERSADLERAGLLAVLGCGAGPGKTNLMAARAARELDEVDAVRCASAGLDEDPPPGLSTPYALQTLIDELTIAPMVVRDGRPQAIAPLTEGGEIPFPEPVGVRGSLYTLHSEVLTLPRTLAARDCDFRLSLAPAVHAALLELVREPRQDVRPAPPSARTWSAQHVEVRGRRDGAPRTVTVTALTEPHAGWGLGGGIVSTAAVAAATVRLLARGELAGLTGALAPEQALDPEALFAEVERRGCRFEVRVDGG
jgi:saccharopine dehydrogenase (NAD+, L-lysine-forming)